MAYTAPTAWFWEPATADPSDRRAIAVRKLPQLMKQKLTQKHLVLGVALVCVATTSAALTLGRARGAVLLGQPLSLTVAVQADTDDAAADLCFDADVYYGDNRQDASRVSVVAVRQESGVPHAVRVNVTSPIDEPVVTVYLRSACGQKTSRKYVLLSDLASDTAPALPDESVARTARAPQPAAVNAAVAVPSVVPSQANTGKPNTGNPPATVKKQAAAVKKPEVSRPSVVLKPATPSKPRLKLSILDLVDIKDPTLKLSNELGTLPSDDPQKRDAALALWRSLNTSPQDLMKDETQQKALSDDLKSLREISAKNQKELQALSARLQQAESERYSNPLVYALGALLLMAALALVAFFLKLRGRGDDSPWWRSESPHDDDDGELTQPPQRDSGLPSFSPKPSAASVDTVVSPRKVDAPPAPLDFSDSGLDIDLDLDTPAPVGLQAPQPVQRKEVAAAVSAKSAGISGEHRDLSHSMHASLHAINTQEMLDVRQQADFFMTLGQHEEAISVLEGSIRENEASNPLVYLDLLKVLHTLSRKPAFDHYRSEFNAIFTGRVQVYATFGQPGNALDAYPQICSEISELWGSDAAVEFLEQCMVRRPEDAPEMYFDLDAFRDLLLLHAVASRISLNRISDSGLMPFSTVKLSTTPEAEALSLVALPEGMTEQTMPVQPVQPVGHGLTVDLDLSSDDHNLIDFDASGLTVNLPSAEDPAAKP